MILRHPETDLLLEYAAGALSIAPSISVTTHLAFCDHCKNTVDSFNDVGGSLFAGPAEETVSEGLLDSVLACLSDEEKPSQNKEKEISTDPVAQQLPAYVQAILPGGELPWRNLSRSVRVAPISVGEDQFELALHRIDCDGKAPHHDHNGREITVVLTGSFSDEDGMYQPGDFIVREPGDSHQPSAARNEECICLSVLEAPIRLTGLKRVFNPFISFSPS